MDDILYEPDENYKTGYIKIFRSVKNHWLYEPKRKRTKLEAWYDLLLMAKYSDIKEAVGYDFIVVERGQILTSQDRLSREWKWDRGAVRLFLSSLHKDHMIVLNSTSKYTMITICNYDTYQASQPSTPPSIQHHSHSTTTTYNKDKKDKKDNNRGNKLPLTEKELFFLKITNEITGRNYKVLDTKTRKALADILADGYNSKQIKKALKMALSEMTSRDKQNYLTPEFITRPAEFSKYVNMEPIIKQDLPSGATLQTINHDDRA